MAGPHDLKSGHLENAIPHWKPVVQLLDKLSQETLSKICFAGEKKWEALNV